MFYEIQGLGRFILQLGTTVGWRARLRAEYGVAHDHVLAVNQFQQSPLDPALGDLSLRVEDRYCMIEFKREETEGSEERKLGLRQAIRANLAKWFNDYVGQAQAANHGSFKGVLWATGPKYSEVSQQCHFLCDLRSELSATRFVPYASDLNLVDSARNDHEAIVGQTEFIDLLLQKGHRPVGVSGPLFQHYLEMLFTGPVVAKAPAAQQMELFVVRIGKLGELHAGVEDLAAYFPKLRRVPRPATRGPKPASKIR